MVTTTIETLPNEILLRVFGDIDLDEKRLNVLAKMTRVCKQWKELAQPLLYSRLHLNIYHLQFDEEDDDNDNSWKIRASKIYDDLSPHLLHEGLFLKNSGFVRNLSLDFNNNEDEDEENESETPDDSNLANLVRRLSPFKNVTSLSCKGGGPNVSSKKFWTILSLIESLFPRLQCLNISRVVGWGSGPGEVPAGSILGRNPAGKKTGSIKDIKVSLHVTGSDGHHIDELFGNIVETLGMEAAGLVSKIDLYLEHTGAVRRHRRQAEKLKYLKLTEEDKNDFENKWRVNNLRRLKFVGWEGLYLVPDLIHVDGCFEKLEWLEVTLSNWNIWKDELQRTLSESPTSPTPFPNVETFKIDIRTVAEANRTINSGRKQGSAKWFRDLLNENLVFFPKLREFIVGEWDVRRCDIERKADGEVVIGEDYFFKKPWSPLDEM
ncbi:hypothetical protein TWF506_004315 [Arthrobotrys conoides]|uniref:F-box domain-containing protein n=1 Tax=Arthrobotrys conoides TaxID=74498 RepID=A0AAN8N2Y4_9PEZI